MILHKELQQFCIQSHTTDAERETNKKCIRRTLEGETEKNKKKTKSTRGNLDTLVASEYEEKTQKKKQYDKTCSRILIFNNDLAWKRILVHIL